MPGNLFSSSRRSPVDTLRLTSPPKGPEMILQETVIVGTCHLLSSTTSSLVGPPSLPMLRNTYAQTLKWVHFHICRPADPLLQTDICVQVICAYTTAHVHLSTSRSLPHPTLSEVSLCVVSVTCSQLQSESRWSVFFLTYHQKIHGSLNGSLTVDHNAYIIGLLSFHHMGIFFISYHPIRYFERERETTFA